MAIGYSLLPAASAAGWEWEVRAASAARPETSRTPEECCMVICQSRGSSSRGTVNIGACIMVGTLEKAILTISLCKAGTA